MKFPRYWAKGPTTTELKARNPFTGEPMGEFSCWGWSDQSVEEAREKGSQRADAVVARLRSGRDLKRYLYGDLPLRKEGLEK